MPQMPRRNGASANVPSRGCPDDQDRLPLIGGYAREPPTIRLITVLRTLGGLLSRAAFALVFRGRKLLSSSRVRLDALPPCLVKASAKKLPAGGSLSRGSPAARKRSCQRWIMGEPETAVATSSRSPGRKSPNSRGPLLDRKVKSHAAQSRVGGPTELASQAPRCSAMKSQ